MINIYQLIFNPQLVKIRVHFHQPKVTAYHFVMMQHVFDTKILINSLDFSHEVQNCFGKE